MSKIIQFSGSTHGKEKPIKPSCLQITFFECHPRQAYIDALQNTIRDIESGMLEWFESAAENE